MRAMTLIPRALRGQKRSAQVTAAQVKKAKRWGNSRLCGNMDKLCNHVLSIEKTKKSRVCMCCGKPAYTLCRKCKDESRRLVALHYNSKGGKGKGLICFYHYHNDSCFGLGKNDSTLLLKGKKGDWEPPSVDDITENAMHVRDLCTMIGQDEQM